MAHHQRRQAGPEQRAQHRGGEHGGGDDGARHNQDLRLDGQPGELGQPGGGHRREQGVGLEVALGRGVVADLEQPQDAFGQYRAEQRESGEAQVLKQPQPEQRAEPRVRNEERPAERGAKD